MFKRYFRFAFYITIGMLMALYCASFLIEPLGFNRILPSVFYQEERPTWLAFVLILGLFLSMPSMQGMQINLRHILNLKNLYYAPPAWLGIAVGWILGGLVAFSKIETIDCVLLSLMLIIFIAKNVHHKKSLDNSMLADDETEYVFQRVEKLCENEGSTSPKEIIQFFKKIKNWFSHEEPIPIGSYYADLLPTCGQAQETARQLSEAMEKNTGLRIGVVGPIGCGKSSMINLIISHLQKNNSRKIKPIICKINMWGCSSSAVAQEYILEELLKETALHFDSSSFAPIAEEWKSHIEGSEFGIIKALKSFWRPSTFRQRLEALSDLLTKLDYHLIIIIEDIDRPSDPAYHSKQIQGLLEQLKLPREHGGLDCSIIVAGNSEAIEFSRLCECTLSPPSINVYLLRKIILTVTRAHIPKEFDEWSSNKSIEWSLLYGDNAAGGSLGSSAAHIDIFSLLDFQRLIGTPRNLKCFLRRLDSGWNRLQGRLNYFDYFLVTLLRIALPESLDFLHTHHEILCTIDKMYNSQDSNNDQLNSELQNLKYNFEEHRKTLKSQLVSFDKIVALLFGTIVYQKLDLRIQINERTWPKKRLPSVLSTLDPEDYWNIAYTESTGLEIKETEVS